MDDEYEMTGVLDLAELAAKYGHLGFVAPKPKRSSSSGSRRRRPPPRTGPSTYQLLAHLGTGGMGNVHHARRISDSREVALKILTWYTADRPLFRARFDREIELLRRFSHPHIVSMIDADPHPGWALPWLALEYCPNGSLGALLRANPAGISVRRAVELVRQVGLALEYLHAHGVVHRDVKPDNVLVARDGSARLSDLGIAHTYDHNSRDVTLTVTGDVLGTKGYMAPEQRAGQRAVDARTDVWALGGLAWELLTGKPCPDAAIERVDALKARGHELEPRSIEAILKCREVEPGCRWPSVQVFLAQLQV